MLDLFRERLAGALKNQSPDHVVNMKGASLAAGLGPTYARDILEKGRDPRLSHLVKFVRAHGLSIDELVSLPREQRRNQKTTEVSIQIVGEVGAGTWHEFDGIGGPDFPVRESPVPPDPRWPHEAQFDLVVRGNSINRFARDGSFLRCVDVAKADVDIRDGDLVVVLRRRFSGQLCQTTAKRLRRRGPIVELWPDSDDPRWQDPEVLNPVRAREDEEASVVALVLFGYVWAGHIR